MANEQVFLGIPSYGNMVHEGLIESVRFGSARGLLRMKQTVSFSILTHNFNILFAAALTARKHGITHFALHHDDISPEFYWLDKMMDLMNHHGADILSAVSPIKDPKKGLTSTALDEPFKDEDPRWRVRRLTLNEIHKNYEPTFTTDTLLVNSGLMLVDIRKPRVEKIAFRFENDIVQTTPGEFKPVVIS